MCWSRLCFCADFARLTMAYNMCPLRAIAALSHNLRLPNGTALLPWLHRRCHRHIRPVCRRRRQVAHGCLPLSGLIIAAKCGVTLTGGFTHQILFWESAFNSSHSRSERIPLRDVITVVVFKFLAPAVYNKKTITSAALQSVIIIM